MGWSEDGDRPGGAKKEGRDNSPPKEPRSVDKRDRESSKDADDKKSAKDDGTRSADEAGGSKPELGSIPAEKKTQVRSASTKHNHRSGRVNFRIGVGVAVPRSVELYAVPENVVVIYPAYWRYKYFVSGGEIVIVDPDTYEIVKVIIVEPESGKRVRSTVCRSVLLTRSGIFVCQLLSL